MSNRSSRPKVLVVDDHPDTVSLVGAMLQESNYELFPAYDGNQALDLAERVKPDLVVLDARLPGQDGWLVCAKLKAMRNSPKVLICTGLSRGDSDRFAGFVHADEIIHKPLAMKEFVGTVRRLLDNAVSSQV